MTMNDSASETRRLAKIIGAALGTTTRRNICPRLAPMLSADHTRMVRVWRTP